MARRRKLEAPDAAELAAIEEGFAAKPVPDRLGVTPPPIAAVAGEAARLSEPQGTEQRVKAARDAGDAAAFRAAEAEGRVIRDLPMDRVIAEHIVRDRMFVSAEELRELKTSLRLNGQRLPIEVVDLGEAGFGLISGWRRLLMLKELAEEDPARPPTIRAIVRSPMEAGAAYAAMVEENEIRAQLSPYERGRIAVMAADQGAFRSPEDAVDTIFAVASKAKRSKIRSFALVHEELGDMLTFPSDLSERNGLRLAQAIRNGFGPDLREALATGLGTDPAKEWAVVEPVVSRGDRPQVVERGGRPRREDEPERVALAHGITMERVGHADGFSIRLRGRRVTADLVEAAMAEVRRLLGPF